MSNVISLKTQEEIDDTPNRVVFCNDGEIDMRAVKTMGLSAKDNPNAIGYFGTGLKYAIAVLLREGQKITIYSGKDEYCFEKEGIAFRGSDFEIVTMNGHELPFTTELGKNWELWQAYRELHCNCTDEFGVITALAELPQPKEGKTVIVCEGQEIEQCYSDRGTIVLDAEPMFTSANVEVISGSTHHLFYKNIRAADVNHCLYTYNLKNHIDLTEDRTIKYVWMARGKIMNAVLEAHDRNFIRSVLLAPNMTFEANFNFTDTSEATATPSKEFLEVAGELHKKVEGNPTAHEIYKKHFRAINGRRGSVKLTANQKQMLKTAQELASYLGYKDSYPVTITNDLEVNVLGLAESGEIYVNIRCFAKGVRTVAHALYEEYLHLEHGFDDESRAMQNFLFEKIIELGAEINEMPV